MKIRKEIAYAYPTSPNAKELGFYKTGCYHISVTYLDIEGSGQCRTFVPHNAEGFERKDNPALLAEYAETEGEPWDR